MKDLMLEYLKDKKRKRIKTKDIENYLIECMGQGRYWANGGYRTFAEVIHELVDQELIRPIKARKKNGLKPSLYNWYNISSLKKKISPEVKNRLLTHYHPGISTSYYLDNPDKYEEDKFYLDKLDKFLKEIIILNKLSKMSVNERSFQIFRDEKFLSSKQGKTFLKRIGFNYNDLKCYPTFEPFFYYEQVGADQEINLLIIENKDTFFTLKSLLQDNISNWNGINFDLLIYGEGNKILKSIDYYYELEQYQQREANFYYFGDLDREGVSIWYRLQNRQIKPEPFIYFYNKLIELYGTMPLRQSTSQSFNQEAVHNFLDYFDTDSSKKISEILESGKYIPQEGLSYQTLVKISNNNQSR